MLVEYQTNKQLWFCFSPSHGKHGWNASAWACEWNGGGPCAFILVPRRQHVHKQLANVYVGQGRFTYIRSGQKARMVGTAYASRLLAPTPHGPHTTPPTAPSTTPSTTTPRHPTPPRPAPPPQPPAPAPTAPHTTPSTAPSAAPKADTTCHKIPAQKKFRGQIKKWNQGSVAPQQAPGPWGWSIP